jgi:hypothetical protein
MPAISPPPPSNARDVARFVGELDHRLERFDRAILIADWNLQVGRSRVGAGPWQLRRAQFLSDDRLLPWVRSALRRSSSRPTHRRLELLERVLLDTQVEQTSQIIRLRSELSERITTYRPRWKGKRVNRAVLSNVIQKSPVAADRRAAHLALEPLYRPLERGLHELIELRNERARAFGYRNLAEMRHSFDHLTSRQVRSFAESTALLARPRLRNLRDTFQESTGDSSWNPWDFLYARELQAPLPDRWFPREEMLPSALRAARAWGFHTDRMRFRVVFHDTPFGGLTLAPDPPEDVRILVHPQGGWTRTMVMFHEVGHAVHSASIRAPRHLLRWHENVPGFGALHEGIGGLFEEIPSGQEWLTRQPRVDRRRALNFAETHRDGALAWAAWHACWIRVEDLLYERPGQDPMPEADRFARRVFGYDEFPRLSFVDPFFVDSPIYGSNYLLAILFGQQLLRTLRELYGDPIWPNRRVGPWLVRNWMAPGSQIDWVPHLRAVTGRPFGIEAFTKAFAGA